MSVIKTNLLPSTTSTELVGHGHMQTFLAIIGSAKEKRTYVTIAYGFYTGNHLSLAGNSIFLAVFAVLLVLQFSLSVHYHQWYVLVFWTLGLTVEVIGYAGRIWSSLNITNINPFIMQSVCITIGPSYFMAGTYYIFAQIVVIFGPQYSILKPMMYSYVFILAGTIASVLQGTGGGISASGNLITGTRLLIAGLALQIVITCAFILFWSHFMWSVHRSYKSGNYCFNPNYSDVRKRKAFALLLGAITIVAILICERTIYRLVEFVEFEEGKGMNLAYNEHFFLTFESLLISLAAIIMTAFHPGFAYGKSHPIYVNRKGKDRLEYCENQYENNERQRSYTRKHSIYVDPKY